MNFVVAGGGTGGHIYPALAIAGGLTERFPKAQVVYIGGQRGLETSIVGKTNLPFYTVASRGLSRKNPLHAAMALVETTIGVWQARCLLKRLQPVAVIGTGGFVCAPVMAAALSLGMATAIHEQNAFPGIANRLLAPYVDKVLLTFEDAEKHLRAKKIVVTGLPVRREILHATRMAGRAFFGIDQEKFVLLATGGSRGARQINQALVELALRWAGRSDCHIIHVTGQNNYEDVKQQLEAGGIDLENCGNITTMPYLDRMDLALAAADLCLGRAGAAFLAEMTVRGLPGILVPYPFAAENHQEANARSLEVAGAASVILDNDLNGKVLIEVVEDLRLKKDVLDKMGQRAAQMAKPQALDKIVEEIVCLL